MKNLDLLTLTNLASRLSRIPGLLEFRAHTRATSAENSGRRIGWTFLEYAMMNHSPVDSSRADRRGMLVASLCFVHCVAGPVLLSVSGMASLISVSERFEPLFLLGSAAMGAIALVPAYRKKHGRVSCIALFASGLLCLLLRRYAGWLDISIETIATAVGVGLIIGAHALNLRFSRRCACCNPSSEDNSRETS